MFAVLAIVAFLLNVFNADIGVDLLSLGLTFLAAQALLAWWPVRGDLRARA